MCLRRAFKAGLSAGFNSQHSSYSFLHGYHMVKQSLLLGSKGLLALKNFLTFTLLHSVQTNIDQATPEGPRASNHFLTFCFVAYTHYK